MGVLADQIEHLGSPAILLGNGINQTAERFMSWDDLLKRVSDEETLDSEGMTYPELFSFIQLNSGLKEAEIKQRVCNEFTSIEFKAHDVFERFLNVSMAGNCPVLTTNFDLSLKSQKGLQTFRLNRKGFTRYYPWDTYFSNQELVEAWEGFGVWHIHGFTKYPDSVRMGLSDYMGSVSKARIQVQGSLRSEHPEAMPSFRNWLDIWFRKPLIIVGLALETQEVFIRWLLLERKRYYSKHGMDAPPIVLLLKKGTEGNHRFLHNLGATITWGDTYSDLYC